MRYNALSETYEEVEVLGKLALFTICRLDKTEIPEGFFLYEVRHDDDGEGDPVQIAKGILVNHYGTILTTEELELPADGYLDIDPEKDWNFLGGRDITIEEFKKEHNI